MTHRGGAWAHEPRGEDWAGRRMLQKVPFQFEGQPSDGTCLSALSVQQPWLNRKWVWGRK